MSDPSKRTLKVSERVFLAIFALANLVVPAVLVEYYPFTMAPMYDARLSEFQVYEIFTPSGAPLRAEDVGLGLVNLGSAGRATTPYHRHRARIPFESVNVLGLPAPTPSEIAAVVGPRLAPLGLSHVTVVQTTYGALDSERAGPVRKETFQVRRAP